MVDSNCRALRHLAQSSRLKCHSSIPQPLQPSRETCPKDGAQLAKQSVPPPCAMQSSSSGCAEKGGKDIKFGSVPHGDHITESASAVSDMTPQRSQTPAGAIVEQATVERNEIRVASSEPRVDEVKTDA